jgi:glycosyltransferase
VNRENPDQVTRFWKSGQYRPNSFLWGWMPPHPTFFVKKEIYAAHGVFNTALRSAADYELMLRFIHKVGIKLAYLPDVLVKMRVGGQSNVTLSNRLKANKEDRRAWDLNKLTPYWFTLYLKPLRKVSQFLFRS